MTIGEILMARTPVLLADEISTGLDSATAFDICSALKAVAREMNRTIAVSLLQPTPETYDLFDEVLVMAAGQIAYLGPREQVLLWAAVVADHAPAADCLGAIVMHQDKCGWDHWPCMTGTVDMHDWHWWSCVTVWTTSLKKRLFSCHWGV